VAGYLIAVIAFTLPLSFGAAGVGRPRLVIALGSLLAGACAVTLVAGRAEDGRGGHVVPAWFLAGLAAILYVLWCGGLWLGLRLRKARAH
jgi:hypothetical protein